MVDFGPHFKQSEFDSPDASGSGERMQPVFIEKLKKAREIANVPFKINSGFRTFAHNKKVGGEPNSSHMKGFAADIGYSSGSIAWIIFFALIEAGFTRIGVYKSWIHADCDPELSPKVLWSK